jgi:hypothetical protein
MFCDTRHAAPFVPRGSSALPNQVLTVTQLLPSPHDISRGTSFRDGFIARHRPRLSHPDMMPGLDECTRALALDCAECA